VRSGRGRRAWRLCAGAAALALAGLVLAGCTGGTTTTSGFTVTPTTVTGVTLSTEQSPAGRVLATPGGHTLYDFTPDTSESSACTSQLCTQVWPPLITTGTPTVGKGLDQALVGTIRRPDGSLQVTYGGHPLYTWIGDSRPGMITGQALLNVGGYWYVVSPAGQQITTAFKVAATAIRH
jgi:predicted lipoprotein with Yx(FWY)xxD motif